MKHLKAIDRAMRFVSLHLKLYPTSARPLLHSSHHDGHLPGFPQVSFSFDARMEGLTHLPSSLQCTFLPNFGGAWKLPRSDAWKRDSSTWFLDILHFTLRSARKRILQLTSSWPFVFLQSSKFPSSNSDWFISLIASHYTGFSLPRRAFDRPRHISARAGDGRPNPATRRTFRFPLLTSAIA